MNTEMTKWAVHWQCAKMCKKGERRLDNFLRSMVLTFYNHLPPSTLEQGRNRIKNADLGGLLNLVIFWNGLLLHLLCPGCGFQPHTTHTSKTHTQHPHMVGAENMFPFRSEFCWITLYEVRGYFVRSSVLLRSKFRATLYKVQLLHTKCVHSCKSTLYQVRAMPTLCKVWQVRTSHANIISAATIHSYVHRHIRAQRLP